MPGELIIQFGKHKGQKLVFPDSRFVIGRDESAHIRLASTDVSRKHCEIHVTNSSIRVRDLKSRNGTFVNSEPISDWTELQPGDWLVVGQARFQVPGSRLVPDPHKTIAVDEDTRTPSANDTTDDDIANWLSEEEDADFTSGGTTILRSLDSSQLGRHAGGPMDSRRRFDSLAEEAADIIRRHQESEVDN